MSDGTQVYSHRNGEGEPPTEAGWYWFSGRTYDNGGTSGVWFVTITSRAFVVGEAGEITDWEGKWYGPIVPPWKTPSPVGASMPSLATIIDELERLCLTRIDEINDDNNIHTIMYRACLAWLAQAHRGASVPSEGVIKLLNEFVERFTNEASVNAAIPDMEQGTHAYFRDLGQEAKTWLAQQRGQG